MITGQIIKNVLDFIIEITVFGISYLSLRFVSMEVNEFVALTNIMILKPFKIIMIILCCFSIFLKYKRGQEQLGYMEIITAYSLFFIYDEVVIFSIIASYFIVNYLIPEGDYLDLFMLWINKIISRGFVFSIFSIIIYLSIFFYSLSLFSDDPFIPKSVLHYNCALYSVLFSYLFVFVFGINFYIWLFINGIRYIILREKV
ncbi:hypothetical protein QJ854_gp071 [Moumouvirus goulette]|uniref:Uncharacterized protein n=1 Tax=Moumouvirus goulette TaxID=1247379 RepID=M1PNV0_9VIRU|nr:hypothetical protein QJ854_gp071 [Moumouvirus goulette]AGF85711.1 hypothetical protein glt_00908 [Moumouvirus goulette]